VYDDDVKAAVAAFQTSQGLPATGDYDQATDEALRAVLGGAASSISQATADLQLLLTQLGFYTGPIDGRYTKAVVDAVKALQTALGVPATGIVDAATLRAAYEQGLAARPEPPVPSTTTTEPPPTTTAPPPTVPDQPDVVDTLTADPRFTTFAGLVIIAGLRDELAGGPYTVFAPTNEAFAALGADVLGGLLADPAALRNVLLYHVVPGSYPSGSLVDGALPTLNGGSISISLAGGVEVNGVSVVATDIVASNGVIHGVAGVLSPAVPL
jgi:uncharacterized surface protein with fasciclin (FAS1) repeats